MNSQQRTWFALLGGDLQTFDKYMAATDNCTYRSIKYLHRYDNLPESALKWAAKEGLLDLI